MSHRTIHKYPIVGPSAELPLHELAQCIAFQKQHDVATSWWIDDVDAPSDPVKVLVLGTGHTVPDGAIHLGTLQDGPYVWHLFRERSAQSIAA